MNDKLVPGVGRAIFFSLGGQFGLSTTNCVVVFYAFLYSVNGLRPDDWPLSCLFEFYLCVFVGQWLSSFDF
jgi:hypothetical protein